jgi:hypothetical protein
LSTKQGFVLITSGSFGEGLEMKGSDVDMMFVCSIVHVYEDINKVRLNSREDISCGVMLAIIKMEIQEGQVISVSLFMSCS